MVIVELRHHGIKGQRWGIRRFQQRDGSLTPLGKRRRRKGEGSDGSDSAKKEEKTKPKTAKEMTDDELKTKIERLRLEKTYKDLDREVNPQNVSRGKKFVNDFIDKAIIPAATEAGKDVLKKAATKYASKALGLEEEKTEKVVKEVDQLKEEWNILNYKQKIKEMKDKEEASAKDEKDGVNKMKSETERIRAETDNLDAKAKYEEAKKKASNSKPSDSDDGPLKDSAKETVNKARKPSENKTVFDAEYTEVPEETREVGKSFIEELLRDQK